MAKRNIKYFLFLGILVLAILVRFYDLEHVPAGFHQDEVSQAYNAFSLLKTGSDRYGEPMPILFRSFGSYQPPVYTYLSVIPMFLFGNTVFAARFLSAFAGVFVVFITYFIVVKLLEGSLKEKVALFASFVVAISPWAIHFSRRVVEGNVGIAFFLLAIFVFIQSLKRPKLFPLASFVLGISTHAYYSERVLSILFLPIFIFVFRKAFSNYKKFVIAGLLVFFATQIPHIWIISSGAFSRRFDQVSYFANDPGNLPKALYIAREFVRHVLIYISPSNLFADTGSDLARVSPDLGVFYFWFFLPFLLGIWYLVAKIRGNLLKLIAFLGPISVVPASLTGDVFYPLRTLEFLWIISLLVGIGLYVIYKFLKTFTTRIAVIVGLTVYSLFTFYVSYFVLFQYETTEYIGESYVRLGQKLKNYSDYNIIIGSSRDFANGLRYAYFEAYDPKQLSLSLRPQLSSDYYSSDISLEEIYTIRNVVVRPINWGKDRCAQNTIIVGDILAISDTQAKEHNLAEVFDIRRGGNEVILRGYETSPDAECKAKLL